MLEIPLTNDPEQLFSITLNGEVYDCRVMLNYRGQFWTITISQEEVELITGVPLLGGVDIFEQYNIPIQNAFVVNLDDTRLDPTRDNLGEIARLFILEDSELVE